MDSGEWWTVLEDGRFRQSLRELSATSHGIWDCDTFVVGTVSSAVVEWTICGRGRPTLLCRDSKQVALVGGGRSNLFLRLLKHGKAGPLVVVVLGFGLVR